MATYTIQDKSRTMTVFGEKLADSSSYAPGKTRWIEFTLYKSDSGIYVVHRVGYSKVYHTSDCETAIRNHLEPSSSEMVDHTWNPCILCHPDSESEYVFPEDERHHVSTCESPGGVLDFLSMYDPNSQSTYYTNAAIDLLEAASKVDADISDTYYGDDAIIL